MTTPRSKIQCPECDYDLAGLTLPCKCPECGMLVSSASMPRPALLASPLGRSLLFGACAGVLELVVGYLVFMMGGKELSLETVVGGAVMDSGTVLLLAAYAAAGAWAAIVPARRRPSLLWLVWTGLALVVVGILAPAKGYA